MAYEKEEISAIGASGRTQRNENSVDPLEILRRQHEELQMTITKLRASNQELRDELIACYRKIVGNY